MAKQKNEKRRQGRRNSPPLSACFGAIVSTVSSGVFLSLHAFICGGNWNNGVHDGDRAVNCNNYPWNVNTNIGVWCVCDWWSI